MKHIPIAKLYKNTPADGAELTVCGWVRTMRTSGAVTFVELNDGSCFRSMQAVAAQDATEGYSELISMNVGAALRVKGTLCMTPEARQPFELKLTSFEVEGTSTPDYPLQKKRHTVEYLRTIAHLRPRTNTFGAAFRVRSVCAFALHSFFNENGFVYVNTPIITASDCEGAGEMFRVTTLDAAAPPVDDSGVVDFRRDFFGKPTSLTVSGQLSAECMALAMGSVYTFGPTFRAENSNTPRHAAEFWMLEPEMAFADLSDDMDLAESMLKYVIATLLKQCPDELAFFNEYFDKELITRLKSVVSADFARVTYTEAVELLQKSGQQFEYPVSWGVDLQTEHERYITEKIYGRPVFVTDYPREIKAFYMRLNDDGKTVAATDLLVPGVGELIGGSQREEREDYLLKALEHFDLNAKDYDWYIQLRRYGGCTHSGFGLGFERLLMYVTGIPNIRDVIPFPRTTGSAAF